MVTHEPEDEKYVNRVVMLSDGFIEKEKDPLIANLKLGILSSMRSTAN
jgi:ABC-type lipoprotein export system ATPase subunit